MSLESFSKSAGAAWPCAAFIAGGRAAYLYTAYELAHAAVYPYRALGRNFELLFSHANSPWNGLPVARMVRAGWQVFDELTRRYGKPEFGITSVSVQGVETAVAERCMSAQALTAKPFGRLVHFDKGQAGEGQPKVLIIAPMSGHFATLVRGTVRAMLEQHDVYVTDWQDARLVPVVQGTFDLDGYIDYLLAFFRFLGPRLHVIAVCQPSVAALAATALLAQEGDPCQPASLTLMGGPIDTDANPTLVNEYATGHTLDWFRRHTITYVPFPHMGAMRPVYPGFLQLAGFMGMNADNHIDAFHRYFERLVRGDADSAAQHRRFYDEYLSVMDLTAEFFLQTVDRVFQQRALARGVFEHRGRRVDCAAIEKTALMTVEGERDDICGIGQTQAAHALCSNLKEHQRTHYVQPGVGHYGVFNGVRWRTEIRPRIRQMIMTVEQNG
ncbi:MAG: polyhydroxyalkanoate depolymerase [Gammaproteobacteria bacterium]|nr:polyhydroxyalkanoate depolymerase [Gammaproteobacteria bacterium]